MSATTPTRIIKRYANRKLYDTRDSKYVTLDQISEMIRIGEEINVIDNSIKVFLISLLVCRTSSGERDNVVFNCIIFSE